MKVTLNGVHAGSGGKESIKISGDLAIEGFDLSAISEKLCELQGQVTKLQATVSRLQEQCIRSSVGELGKALETMKEEPVVAVEETAPSSQTELLHASTWVTQSVVEDAPVVKSTSKKK